MRGKVQSHRSKIKIFQSPSLEVDAGGDVPLRVGVSCRLGCDLRGNTVRVVAHDGTIAKEVALTSFQEGVSETDEFTVKAPIELGEYDWTVVFPAQGDARFVVHKDSSTPVILKVKPHSMSIAVWGVASPIPFGDSFKVKVGVKCSAACKLTGSKIGIYGHERNKLATASLGSLPWRGTNALYWAEVELEAPSVEGYYSCTVRFLESDAEVLHKEGLYEFGFTTTRPPEHVVTVHVIGQDTQAPLQNAHVLLVPLTGYPHRRFTDERGVAILEVAKGSYTLYASKGGEYPTFQTAVNISGDATVEAEIPFHFDPYR